MPVINGKRHTLPRPIAQPAEIRIKPSRDEKFSRSIVIKVLSLCIHSI